MDYMNAQENPGTALTIAAEADHMDAVRLLLSEDADVDLSVVKTTKHFAMKDNKGIHDPSQRENSGTALMFAALNGNLPMVQLLIKHGATLNMKGPAGQTAYDFSVIKKHDECARELLAAKKAQHKAAKKAQQEDDAQESADVDENANIELQDGVPPAPAVKAEPLPREEFESGDASSSDGEDMLTPDATDGSTVEPEPNPALAPAPAPAPAQAQAPAPAPASTKKKKSKKNKKGTKAAAASTPATRPHATISTSISPPRSVTKMLRHTERLIDQLTTSQLQCLRDETIHITIHIVKYADEEDRSLWFGLAAANGMWPDKQARLACMPWSRSLDSWGATEWAWFTALLWNQASDVMPVGAGCGYSVLPHYKFHPEDPSTFAADMEREFRAIVALPRFADDQNSSLHTFGPGGVEFTPVEVDSDGDAARVPTPGNHTNPSISFCFGSSYDIFFITRSRYSTRAGTGNAPANCSAWSLRIAHKRQG